MIAYRPQLFLFSPPRASYRLVFDNSKRLPLPGRRVLKDAEAGGSSVVFSPHFDDEVLGVGATILWKRAAMVPVTIAFMTDGTKSHRAFLSETVLSKMRKQEAMYAARRMGVEDEKVVFLDVEEGRVAQRMSEAIARVIGVLSENKYDEVYIPHSAEPPLWSLDHRATRQAVLSAMKILGYEATVREYPVWAWYHLPSMNPFHLKRHELRSVLRNTAFQAMGIRLTSTLNVELPLTEGLRENKRHALAAYRSQTEKLIPGVNWPTLDEVAGGDFLDHFFGKSEFFHQYRFEPVKSNSKSKSTA